MRNKVLTRNKNNAKKIWEAINDLTHRKTKTSAPNKLQKENGDHITDSEEMAEEFNNFLSTSEAPWLSLFRQ